MLFSFVVPLPPSFSLGNAYNESYTKFSSRRKAAFSSKVFTAWDFNITDVDTAKLKKVHIRTDLEVGVALQEGGLGLVGGVSCAPMACMYVCEGEGMVAGKSSEEDYGCTRKFGRCLFDGCFEHFLLVCISEEEFGESNDGQ